jgi:glycosyltransferase involved in cell wall biosynthesis
VNFLKEPMIIACISASRVPSTSANSLQMMKACQAISQLGHEVHLFIPRHTFQTQETNLASFYGLTSQFNIEYLTAQKNLYRYDFALRAASMARRIKADIAYVWFVQAAIFSLIARLPVIFELHGPPEGKFGPSLFRIFQRLGGKKRLLPITNALASQLRERFKLDISDYHLVRTAPNGVDLDRYTNLPDPATARQQLGLPDMLTAGYTGHLYPGRGMALLLELARCFPRIQFIWAGGRQEDIRSWQQRLEQEHITNINLTGYIDNSQLPLYQAAADILLMPYERVISGSSGGNSSSYASPMKMFEYMACRRAIISSDLPVIREVLNPGNALLCPPEDVGIWSQALGSLIYDEDKRLSLANQAWQDIQQFTWLERARKALDSFIVE